MKKILLVLLINLSLVNLYGQGSYTDSLETFIKTYVKDHQVVTGDNKANFNFYPIDKNYRIEADFISEKNSPWINIPTSSGKPKAYRIYGWLQFKIDGSEQKLPVYQSQFLLQSPGYTDYLFLPFKDATNGNETYETGRYMDLKTTDIKDNKVMLDFNKAYNPYCAYVSQGYSCPVPPKEAHLSIAIKAGEKKFAKSN